MGIIRTQRLMLRDLKESDWEAIHSYASDPEVVRCMDWGLNTKEDTENFIKRAIAYQKEEPRRI